MLASCPLASANVSFCFDLFSFFAQMSIVWLNWYESSEARQKRHFPDKRLLTSPLNTFLFIYNAAVILFYFANTKTGTIIKNPDSCDYWPVKMTNYQSPAFRRSHENTSNQLDHLTSNQSLSKFRYNWARFRFAVLCGGKIWMQYIAFYLQYQRITTFNHLTLWDSSCVSFWL